MASGGVRVVAFPVLTDSVIGHYTAARIWIVIIIYRTQFFFK
jgi:hypothetical protein